MSSIGEAIAHGRTLSFEFFPPKTAQGERSLARAVERLATLNPNFVSVTYGAGGSTRDRTRDIVVDMNSKHDFPVLPHLTCIGHTRVEIAELAADYFDHGVDNVLALAGDPPDEGPVEGDFVYAEELVDFLTQQADFGIAVAAHPECHPRSPDRATDRRFLAQKLNKADLGLTSFFFDTAPYFRMLDELAALDCATPVIPGVMPVLNVATIARFSDINGTARPTKLWDRYEDLADDSAALFDFAVDQACELMDELVSGGAPGIHLYALNRSEAVEAIVERSGWIRAPRDSENSSSTGGVDA